MAEGFLGAAEHKLNRRSGDASTLACTDDGGLVLADRSGLRILKLAADGRWVVLAGTGQAGFNKYLDESGQARPALDTNLKVRGRLAPLGDGSVAFFDPDASRIRRVTPEATVETLAGGGEAEAVFAGDGQDLCQDRPARGVLLAPLTGLAAAPGGGLVLATAMQGPFLLAPDGVLHPLVSDLDLVHLQTYHRPSLAVTSDHRVVYDNPIGFSGGESHLYELGAGQALQTLGRFSHFSEAEDGQSDDALQASGPHFPLGGIQQMMPAPGGGLLVATSGRDSVWYDRVPGSGVRAG